MIVDLTAGYWAYRHEELCAVVTHQSGDTVMERCTKPFAHTDRHGRVAETLVRLGVLEETE